MNVPGTGLALALLGMKHRSTLSIVSSFFVALGLTSVSVSAAAQPPAALPPAQPPATSVEPAPGQAAAAPPSSTATQITATCSLGDHPGIDADEARTAADLICHDLARHAVTNTNHEVRFGKLGGRTIVTLASRSGNTYDERRTFVSSLDEVAVAGPRLSEALASGKPLEETRNVDNVLVSESQTARMQRGSMAVDASVFGATALGASSGASAGVDVGFHYRAGSFGVGMHGRAGGIGSGDEKLALASIDVGGRFYLTASEIAPYVGAGLGFSYFELYRKNEASPEGSGVGAFGELGLELLRTHSVGMATSLRVDAPFYALKTANASTYAVPLSLNLGLLFH